ncbi:Cytoplasmic dynein 1 light intermediate chain 2 [Exaiptasia diaphana]|nr:Cytoplasmic dynein 1 light intermediate chain 2 [Exaiptasia diaphana]
MENKISGITGFLSSILSDVQSSASRKLRAHKSILLLGNDESGKSTLISKLRGKEDDISKGHGLEYTYLDVHDEELDDYTRLNVWILDGDARNKTLLNYALTPQNANDSLIVLVVDSSKPWTIMDSLHSWTEVLREHIHSLKLTPTQLNEMEETIAKQFQEYMDPDEAGSDDNKRRSGAGLSEEKVLLPLEEDVLVDNLGLPVVVVVTKTDCMSALEKDRDYREEHFDFIQQHIRRYCLKYGAALFYTSVKENKNCSLFLKYILHRIYGLPFHSSALVVDKDSVFIPSGWDSIKKINIVNEHLKGIHPDDNFDDHIIKPIQRKQPLQEKEIVAEEEQEFLVKQQSHLFLTEQNNNNIGHDSVRAEDDSEKAYKPYC